MAHQREVQRVGLLLLAVPPELRHPETLDLNLDFESTLRSVADTLSVRLSTKSIDLLLRAFSVQISKTNASTTIHTYTQGHMWNSLARFNDFNTYPVWLFFNLLAMLQWVVNTNYGEPTPLWLSYDGASKWRFLSLSDKDRDLLELATTSNNTTSRRITENKAARMKPGKGMQTSDKAKERLPHLFGGGCSVGQLVCRLCRAGRAASEV